MSSSEKLVESYRKKVLNQELSLKEFAEKQVVLKSKPSKILVDVQNLDLSLFKKMAEELFELAYFVDFRGLSSQFDPILKELEQWSLINWHTIVNESEINTSNVPKLLEQQFMVGIRCSDPSKLKKILDPLRKDSGFVYLIVDIDANNPVNLTDIVNSASTLKVSEIQIKAVTHLDSPEKKKNLVQLIDDTMNLTLEKKIRLTIDNQDLVPEFDPKKLIRASSPPIKAENIPFPMDPKKDLEFSKDHRWSSLDQKVKKQSQVSVFQRCFKPFHFIHFTNDGTIGPCNHLVPEVTAMGNLTQSSFSEIWNGSMYKKFRESLFEKKPLDPRCRWCFKYRLED